MARRRALALIGVGIASVDLGGVALMAFRSAFVPFVVILTTALALHVALMLLWIRLSTSGRIYGVALGVADLVVAGLLLRLPIPHSVPGTGLPAASDVAPYVFVGLFVAGILVLTATAIRSAEMDSRKVP